MDYLICDKGKKISSVNASKELDLLRWKERSQAKKYWKNTNQAQKAAMTGHRVNKPASIPKTPNYDLVKKGIPNVSEHIRPSHKSMGELKHLKVDLSTCNITKCRTSEHSQADIASVRASPEMRRLFTHNERATSEGKAMNRSSKEYMPLTVTSKRLVYPSGFNIKEFSARAKPLIDYKLSLIHI